MLKTAPPETIEAAHAEAFERLTPEQRKLALSSLARHAPRCASPDSSSATSGVAVGWEWEAP